MPLIPGVTSSASGYFTPVGPAEPYDTIMTHSPVLYWRMNDSASPMADSGSGAYPAPITSATFEATAIPDLGEPSIDFTDFNSYGIATGSNLGGIRGVHPSYTIGVWLDADPSAVYPGHHIFTHGSDSTGVALRLVLEQSPSQFKFQVINGGGVEFSLPVPFGNTLWSELDAVFVALVHYAADDLLVFYINGDVAAAYSTASYTALDYTPNDDFVIGGDPGFYDYYDGRMSDLFVVDSALTHAEIQAIYNNSMSPTPPANDGFANAISLAVATDNYLTVDATNQLSIDPTEDVLGVDFVTIGNTVWLKFDPPSTGPWLIDTEGVYMVVFFSPDNTPPVDRTLATGAAYAGSNTFVFHTDDLPNPTDVVYVVLGTYNYGGEYYAPSAFGIDVTVASGVPGNDNFADAYDLIVDAEDYFWFDPPALSWASLEVGETAGGNTTSAWFYFVATSTGTIVFDAGPSDPSIGVRLAIWDATTDGITDIGDVNFGSPLYANNNSSGNGNGKITASVVSGRTYYMQVSATDPLGYVEVYWEAIV